MNPFEPYECIFSDEERKLLVAESMAKLRRNKNLSQKEVATVLGLSQSTYSTYERGRTEPPMELLVRLSHFYQVSLDVIAQRDRLIKNAEDAQKQIDGLKEQMAELEKLQANMPEEMRGLMGSLNVLLGEVEKLNNSGK